MAKSIEQKAVETLASGLSSYQWRHHEFSRLMSEQPQFVHQQFFRLVTAYMNYLSIYHKYDWYPNGTKAEAVAAADIVDTLNEHISKTP